MKIKDLSKTDRPREKLLKYGPGRLSDAELLAIVLRTGGKGMNVVELARKILRKYPEGKLANAPAGELEAEHGLGAAKACEIAACFELGRRMLQDKPAVLVLSPREVWEQLKDVRDNKKEHFVVFFLNTQNRQIHRETVSVGTLNASLAHPREIFEPAIRHAAAHVIVAHNHPSGSLEPSDEDLQVTRRLAEAGRLLGIELLDHVIVTDSGYHSFKEHNLL